MWCFAIQFENSTKKSKILLSIGRELRQHCEGANKMLLFQLRCMYILSYVPGLDNSDSPSIVKQLSQGPSFVYNTFISDSFLAP